VAPDKEMQGDINTGWRIRKSGTSKGISKQQPQNMHEPDEEKKRESAENRRRASSLQKQKPRKARKKEKRNNLE
jgi:hypothetical protein